MIYLFPSVSSARHKFKSLSGLCLSITEVLLPAISNCMFRRHRIAVVWESLCTSSAHLRFIFLVSEKSAWHLSLILSVWTGSFLWVTVLDCCQKAAPKTVSSPFCLSLRERHSCSYNEMCNWAIQLRRYEKRHAFSRLLPCSFCCTMHPSSPPSFMDYVVFGERFNVFRLPMEWCVLF